MSTLRLFTSPQDAIEDARRARMKRARQQTRCKVCGRFTRSQPLVYDVLCERCLYDQRPAIRRKVRQVHRWAEQTQNRTEAATPG